jgi:hypothetical protein
VVRPLSKEKLDPPLLKGLSSRDAYPKKGVEKVNPIGDPRPKTRILYKNISQRRLSSAQEVHISLPREPGPGMKGFNRG